MKTKILFGYLILFSICNFGTVNLYSQNSEKTSKEALVGCSTGSTIQSQHSNKKLDLDIVFIGNSITYGYTLENPKQEAPPVLAAKYLRRKKGINSISFINQGRCGYTTFDYLPLTSTFFEVVNATKILHSNHAHILVFSIELGTNDSAIEGTNGAPVSKKMYLQNMKAIIDELLISFPNSKIVLQQPIYYTPNSENSAKYLAEGLARLQTYFPKLKSLVENYSTTNNTQIFEGDQKGFEYFKTNYLSCMTPENGKQGVFYLHPNKKGASKLGKLWGESIYKSVIRKQ